MWIYYQKSGNLFHDHDSTKPVATGYSGTGEGRNNPNMQNVPNVGPIPRGAYSIGTAYSDPHLGPLVMKLEPKKGTDTFGRSAFRIHGDNTEHDASHGCIILMRPVRQQIADSPDRELIVCA